MDNREWIMAPTRALAMGIYRRKHHLPNTVRLTSAKHRLIANMFLVGEM